MKKFESVVLFILLLFATGAGQAFIVDRGASDSGGEPLIQALFGFLYLLVILFTIKHRSAALKLILTERWLAALCIWALMSVAWSVEPGESLRRALALIGTTLAGLYIASRYEPREQLKAMAWVLGLGAIASAAVIVAVSSVGITQDGMQGIYNLKNSLGRVMSLGAFCFALLALSERRHRMVRILMFLLCFTLLILSKSATAVVVTMLMFALLPLRKLLYLRPRQLLAATAILLPLMAAAAFWIVESSEDILQAMGRNPSLSGRIPLWQLVLKEIAERPIRGYGFTAFWNSWAGERVSDTVKWDYAVPHAHNGFLEVWLGLGFVGLALILINLSRSFILALRAARNHREIEYSWPLLLVLFTVLYNLTENSLLAVNAIPWIAYCAANYWLAGTAREEALEPESQPEAEPAYSA